MLFVTQLQIIVLIHFKHHNLKNSGLHQSMQLTMTFIINESAEYSLLSTLLFTINEKLCRVRFIKCVCLCLCVCQRPSVVFWWMARSHQNRCWWQLETEGREQCHLLHPPPVLSDFSPCVLLNPPAFWICVCLFLPNLSLTLTYYWLQGCCSSWFSLHSDSSSEMCTCMCVHICSLYVISVWKSALQCSCGNGVR